MTIGAYATGIFYTLLGPGAKHYCAKIMYENRYTFNHNYSYGSDLPRTQR